MNGECFNCGMLYTDLDYLRRHQRRAHGNNVQQTFEWMWRRLVRDN